MHHLQRPNLGIKLDLKTLPRDDGPPSETQLRRAKYKHFEKHCSEVAERVYVSGDQVARSAEILSENAITHVVNCVGFICKEWHPDLVSYRTLFLQDTPAEDILCVLYDTFEFVDRALAGGGRVLVHCSQGVSRSATLAIAYLMWRNKGSYDETFAAVKAKRGVVNPNIGFTCQLLQWQKRRRGAASRMRMYRVASHCAHAPAYLVPKVVTPPKCYPNNTYRELDPRGAFIVQTPHTVWVWLGARCPAAAAVAAQHHATLLVKYEAVSAAVEGAAEDWEGPAVLRVIRQGEVMRDRGQRPHLMRASAAPTLMREKLSRPNSTPNRSGHAPPPNPAGSEPASFLSLMDPLLLGPEATRLNARRPSITGDIGVMASSPMPTPLTPSGAPPSDLTLGSPAVSLHGGSRPGSRPPSWDSQQGGGAPGSGSGSRPGSWPPSCDVQQGGRGAGSRPPLWELGGSGSESGALAAEAGHGMGRRGGIVAEEDGDALLGGGIPGIASPPARLPSFIARRHQQQTQPQPQQQQGPPDSSTASSHSPHTLSPCDWEPRSSPLAPTLTHQQQEPQQPQHPQQQQQQEPYPSFLAHHRQQQQQGPHQLPRLSRLHQHTISIDAFIPDRHVSPSVSDPTKCATFAAHPASDDRQASDPRTTDSDADEHEEVYLTDMATDAEGGGLRRRCITAAAAAAAV
ncbi:MAG: hypothetical protein WDW38_011500 [Sanguina aurantia]